MTTPPTAHHPAPTTLRLRDPAGVVAAVPYLLGFVPRSSLVVVGVDDDRSVGPTLRADLPTEVLLAAGPVGLFWQAWAHSCQVMRRNGCTRALVVLYGDVDPADLPPGAVERLLTVLDPTDPGEPPDPAEALDVLDVLLVGPQRFRSLLCPDPTCCLPEGVPVAGTRSHPVAATFVLAGRSPAADRGLLEPPPPPAPPADVAATAGATAAARDTRPAGTRATRRDRGLLTEWLDCLPSGPSPELAGRLAAGWRAAPLLRDACLAAFLPGGPVLARHLLAGTTRPPGTALPASLEDSGCSTATSTGAPVLRRMAALVPDPERAEVLAAHAWLAWASGEGTAAGMLAERALLIEPGQSLAGLVLQCLCHGVGAPWTTAGPGRAVPGLAGRTHGDTERG